MLSRLLVAGIVATGYVQADTYNVTNYGARADAVRFTCSTTTSGISNAIPALSAGDVGKAVILFHVGPATSGTNHQDYIGTLTNADGSLSPAPTAADNVSGIVGTENAIPIRAALAAATGTNDTIRIPGGDYLVIPPFMLTNGVPPADDVALVVSRGGITIQGDASTVLISCGAWQLRGGACYRGTLLRLQPLFANRESPLVVDSITFDGGVDAGYINNHAFPASVTTGDGWDETHGAVWQSGGSGLQVLANTTFSNCAFRHWRGEMFKSTVDNADGWLAVTNCVFYDGDASALNTHFSQRVSSCSFSNLFIVSETWQSYLTMPSFFENSILTNVDEGIVLVGATLGVTQQLYTISGNRIASSTDRAIFLNPARNLLISNNVFSAGAIFAGGTGVQGTDRNGDWIITGNTFSGNGTAAYEHGDAVLTSNVWFVGNTINDRQFVASGYGEASRILFSRNTVSNSQYGTLDSHLITGEWFIDDGSNAFSLYSSGNSADVVWPVSYQYGRGHQTFVPNVGDTSGRVFVLDDSVCTSCIPDGAVLSIYHSGQHDAPLYMSSLLYPAGRTNVLRTGQTKSFNWNNGAWQQTDRIDAAAVTVGTLRGQ